MSLESIFNQTLEEFKEKLNTIKRKSPQLMKNLGFDDQDPHIERMINAFALISASTRYEIENKSEKAIDNVLLNIFDYDFSMIPPMGIIQASSIKQNGAIIDKTIIRSGNSFYKTVGDSSLNNLKINKIAYKYSHDKHFLSIEIIGNFKSVKRIDFFCAESLCNAIFSNATEVNAYINNREEYATECICTFNNKISLKHYLFFAESAGFFQIHDFDSRAITDCLKIDIPLNHSFDEVPYININCLLVENSFIMQSDPLIADHKNDYPIITQEDISILNIQKIESLNGVIPHISIDPNGWYAFYKNRRFFISLGENHCNEEIINAKLLVFNNKLETEDLYFEEYWPCQMKFINGPKSPVVFDTPNYLRKIINFLSQDSLKKQIQSIQELLLMKTELHSFEIEVQDILDSVKAVKIGKYTMPKTGKLIHLNVNKYNPLLFRLIANELRRKNDVFLDFIFDSPYGILEL